MSKDRRYGGKAKHCDWCGSSYTSTGNRQRYCSMRCTEAAKYRRARDAKGVPPKPRYSHCQETSEPCGESVYAKALCKRHYSRAIYKGRTKRLEATCLAYRFGIEPGKVKPFKFTVLSGDRVVSYCPWCDGGTYCLTAEHRVCPYCLTESVINIEEALTLWGTSPRRLTRPRRQAA